MVLVDTSVWIAHLRQRQPGLSNVSGELACGNLKNRNSILSDFLKLPEATRASDVEALKLVSGRKLWGRGLGWIDAHLLASALLSHCRLWTLDKKLGTAAAALGVCWDARLY